MWMIWNFLKMSLENSKDHTEGDLSPSPRPKTISSFIVSN